MGTLILKDYIAKNYQASSEHSAGCNHFIMVMSKIVDHRFTITIIIIMKKLEVLWKLPKC